MTPVSTTRVAVVDCGTNAVRLLVAQAAGERPQALERIVRLVRLGEGVDATGEFAPTALERLFAAVDEFAVIVGAYGCSRTRFVATSAARDVSNRDAFCTGVAARLGVGPTILTGEQEARYSYLGARAALAEIADPVLVTDIGGGSTELVVGEGRDVRRVWSLDVGSVRLRERFLRDDPASAAQIDVAIAFIDGLLDGADLPWNRIGAWVCAGGTATTLAAVAQKLPGYDSRQVHGSTVTPSELDQATKDLLVAGAVDIQRRFPYIPRLRAEVIGAGALICSRIARHVDAPMRVSESDILDAVAAEMLGSA